MVDHVILLEKLEAYGVDNCSLEWFKSYLTNRRQLVSLSGKESGMVNIKHGVPLGPLLFIVFINDLPLHVTSSQIDLYADDTTLIASADYESTQQLQESLNRSVQEVVNWASVNKLPINEKKTKVLLVTGKRLPSKITHTPSITINGTELNNVSSVTLLGLEIDDKLTFDAHVDKICKKISQRALFYGKYDLFFR